MEFKLGSDPTQTCDPVTLSAREFDIHRPERVDSQDPRRTTVCLDRISDQRDVVAVLVFSHDVLPAIKNSDSNGFKYGFR